jgi:hypothetical protein
MSTYEGTGELIALCPTRGNPERALRMVESFYDTVHRIGTELILVIDDDEPREAEYRAIPKLVERRLVGFGVQRPDPPRIMQVPGGSLTKATNEAVALIWEADSIIGHIGDDHVFRTPGWDNAIRDALLAAPGVAYARDGHGSCWASAWWTNASVIRALGWLALPGSKHLTIDDAFMDIGAGTRLTFLTEVTIEHAWDNRSTPFYKADVRAPQQANYEAWLRGGGYQSDIDKLRLMLGLEPKTFDLRDPPGAVWRRDWKLANGYELGRDEPQPTWAELEEIAGRPLQRNTAPWLKARREWFRIARATANV